MADKDLFDDSTMTFGEHLEVLRVHLWKAIIGLTIGTIAAFYFSDQVILALQKPVTQAMAALDQKSDLKTKVVDDVKVDSDKRSFVQRFRDWWSGAEKEPEPAVEVPSEDKSLILEIPIRDVARHLHEADPEHYAELPESATGAIRISLAETPIGKLVMRMREESLIPRTDSPDEAFMIYLKMSLVVGLVLSSPWIFFQIWQFVAAGLYPHERKYVYSYLPFSLLLFLGGGLFCFYVVLPYVLQFLFQFNETLNLRPEIKMSTWITFALVVSLMFGLSFQLPLVMLLLDRISVLSVKIYREKRRFAILIISILSMVLTPSDPVSMMMMMIPLCILYELGILLCTHGMTHHKKSPFEPQAA